jgi:predicted dehydrogenase
VTVNASGTVRIGIIGPSWWVNYWHLPALQNHPNAIIAAICGRNVRDEAEARAKYGPHARIYTDMEAMLNEVPLDGVVVCTPNDLHHPATMAALQHGVHVTCEKPIALNADQAREMAATARAKGLLGMSNFPYRDNPAVREFARLTASGYLGTLLHVRGEYHGGFGLQRPPGWRGTRSRSGAGILGDLGSHLIDLVRYVTGDEFTSVCAHSLTVLREPETGRLAELVRTEDPRVGDRNDDSCAFLAELAGGAQALLHTSWMAYQGAETQHQEIEAYGTEGRLHFIATHTGTQLRGKRTSDRTWELFPLENIVLPDSTGDDNEDYFRPGRLTPNNSTYRWIEAIRTGQTAISPDLTDGWRAQQVIDAVIQASAERRWVDVPRD